MIPQADLERAIARWKARQTGQDLPPEEAVPQSYDGATEFVAVSTESSGLIAIGDDDIQDQ